MISVVSREDPSGEVMYNSAREIKCAAVIKERE
jgi:hypothetical protein